MARSTRTTMVVLLLVSLVITSCTGGTGDTTTTAGSVPSDGSSATTVTTQQSDGEPDDRTNVELLFTIWAQSDVVFETWGAIGDAFAAQDPRVSAVNWEFVPFSRYHDVLNVRIASGEIQDGGWLSKDLAPAYIEAGALYDMTDLYQNTPGWNLDEISESTLAGWSKDGRYFGYPFPQSPWQVFWNRDMFEQAGVKTPEEHIADGTWTWETLVESGKAIQDAGLADWGFEWQQGRPFAQEAGWAVLDPIWAAFDAEPFSADGSQCQLDSPEFTAAMQFVHDMVYMEEAYPLPGGSDPSIWAGESAMGIYHIEAASNQAHGVTFQYGMAPQPAGAGGWPDDWNPAVATNGIAVFDAGPNADIAADFLAFLTHPDNAASIAQLHSSPRPSALSTDLWTGRLDITEEEAGRVIEAVQVGYRFNGHPNWGPVHRESQAVFDASFWNPDANVAEVMTNMCAAIQDLLG